MNKDRIKTPYTKLSMKWATPPAKRVQFSSNVGTTILDLPDAEFEDAARALIGSGLVSACEIAPLRMLREDENT